MTFIRSQIIGHGHYLPSKVLTNDDLSKMVETNDEWITERTGIKSRHIAGDELTSDLAIKAAKMALDRANVQPNEIDLIVLATISPDQTTPATATKVGAVLGIKSPAFDISAACSGFVYGLSVADSMIKTAQVKTALVIGVESLSKITDWTDRNTCILFGDGAGAVVVRGFEAEGTNQDTGILASKLYAGGDISQYEALKATGGISSTQSTGFLWMNGKEVFKFAIPAIAQAAEEVVHQAGYDILDIDWLIPHQANVRIIDGVGKRLNLPSEKVIVTVDHQGNTSAATIPLALSESLENGTIKKGDLVVLSSMGAGFTWGGILVRL